FPHEFWVRLHSVAASLRFHPMRHRTSARRAPNVDASGIQFDARLSLLTPASSHIPRISCNLFELVHVTLTRDIRVCHSPSHGTGCCDNHNSGSREARPS